MKKLILVLLLIISTQAFAQLQHIFVANSYGDMEKKARMVIDIASIRYIINSMNNYNDSMAIYSCSSGNNKLTLEFTSIGNVPRDTFLFSSITGIFSDVFPSWKKYYQPQANYKQIQTTGHGKSIVTHYLQGKIISTLYMEKGVWRIDNKYEQPIKTRNSEMKKNI